MSMLDKVRLKVYGKINLTLNVIGKTGEMHTLDSVLASVSVADRITVRDRLDDKINLIFNADFTPENNTVLKAVNVLKKSFGNFGADIVVDKALPNSGGMGGSSADAAGVIAALNALFDFDKRGLDIEKACSEVGADVFYMYKGGFARMEGTGEKIVPVVCPKEYGLVYINGGGVLTRDVYKKFDSIGGSGFVDNEIAIDKLGKGEVPPLGNMLTDAACSLDGKIRANLNALVDMPANMTGSGSTVYALSEDPDRDVAVLDERGIKAFAAHTVPRGIEFE